MRYLRRPKRIPFKLLILLKYEYFGVPFEVWFLNEDLKYILEFQVKKGSKHLPIGYPLRVGSEVLFQQPENSPTPVILLQISGWWWFPLNLYFGLLVCARASACELFTSPHTCKHVRSIGTINERVTSVARNRSVCEKRTHTRVRTRETKPPTRMRRRRRSKHHVNNTTPRTHDTATAASQQQQKDTSKVAAPSIHWSSTGRKPPAGNLSA